MNFDSIKLKFNKYTYPVKKHSPEILLISGAIAVVSSAVMACRATLKLDSILEDSRDKLNKIDEAKNDMDSDIYSEDDAKKDTLIVGVQTAAKVAKLYAPWVILGGLGLASMFASHGIMVKRSAALAAAYSALDEGFKKYRKNVVDRFGDDIDKELRYGIKAERVSVTEEDENGKERKSKKTVETIDPNDISVYAKFFDELSPCWQNNADINLSYLRAREREANARLIAQGYLFLNDVYDMLGIPRTKAGQVVGWVYDSKKEGSDNYISFHIYDGLTQQKRDFVNGLEKSILLDFNVDGPIDYILPSKY